MVLPTLVFAGPATGSEAPQFTATTASGKQVSLSDFKGKYVVLEWLNYGCPYVRKHYATSNMQTLQTTYTTRGVVWLSVLSSAEGKEGFANAEQAKNDAVMHSSKASELVLDASGRVGKLFEARTTPHMFVIGPDGKVLYQGAIDDNDSTRPATVAGAHNYVAAALDEAMAGKIITTGSTEPYGCSIKYAS